MAECITVKPVGLLKSVELPILEDERPKCCPDRTGCKPFLVTLELNDSLDEGYSGQCYGYCGEYKFTYRQAEHVNDISRCMITPLKGIVRFFNNATDFMGEIGELQRVLQFLLPTRCGSCGTGREVMHGYSKVVAGVPLWLCLACALRLGVIVFDTETKIYRVTDEPDVEV